MLYSLPRCHVGTLAEIAKKRADPYCLGGRGLLSTTGDFPRLSCHQRTALPRSRQAGSAHAGQGTGALMFTPPVYRLLLALLGLAAFLATLNVTEAPQVLIPVTAAYFALLRVLVRV